MKEIQKRCLQCMHALRNPDTTTQQVIEGDVQHLCLEGPPTTIPVRMPQGLALMTVYPTVNKATISCDRFTGSLELLS